MSRALFWLVVAACAAAILPAVKPFLHLVAPGALIAGCALALTLGNPYPAESKKYSKTLLQTAVVLLGFGMDFGKVVQEGQRGLTFAVASIACVFLAGWGLQKLLGIRPLTSLLVSTGTAICGGSAIAAMSTVTDAPQEDVSVAVGTIFLLNAVALFVFPPIGHALHLTGDQFGVWAGIAIHDVSSVVGAATAYGSPGALETATAVKLSRVLYLIPITLIASWYWNMKRQAEHPSSAKPQIPWFIGLFLLASLVRSFVPGMAPVGDWAKAIATAGLACSLFLIGGGLSMKTLKAVGVRPLIQGVALWLLMTLATLGVVKGSA